MNIVWYGLSIWVWAVALGAALQGWKTRRHTSRPIATGICKVAGFFALAYLARWLWP